MCGVFGFITKEGRGPDIARLRHLALITQSRGAHAFGLAWVERDGPIQTIKHPGAAQDYLDELERCRDAVVVIGHCRYATHGSPLDPRNNHPHVAGAGYIVHNGVVCNYDRLARQYHLDLQSQCDSEVLGLLMARGRGSITQRSAWAVNQALGELVLLGIWRKPARLLVTRHGRPLHAGLGRRGYYFASLPDGLPGKAQPVLDHSSCVLALERGSVRMESPRIALPSEATFQNHVGFNHPNTPK